MTLVGDKGWRDKNAGDTTMWVRGGRTKKNRHIIETRNMGGMFVHDQNGAPLNAN